jgi:subtilisin-like proprotein convertase family protein
LAGNLTPAWETCSSVGRTLAFAFTVRDNVLGGGQTNSAATTVTVVNTGAAFAITNPNTADLSWNLGSTQTVTWNVAGTTANGINTANVNILFSTDGGTTFPIVLAANTPNDGSEVITLPSTASPTCRILIEAVGNIFYAVSKNIALGYTITSACNTYSYTTPTPFVDQAPGNYTTRTLNVPVGGSISDINVLNNITHTYLSDVQTDISSPQNPTTFVKLFNRSCGNTSGTLNLRFSDAAAAINCSGGATLQTVVPGESLSSFNGQNPQGDWTFRVYDNFTGDTGTINSWSIEVCTQTFTLSTPSNQFADFAVYPNPNNGNFNIQFTSNSSSANGVKVLVHDMRGRVILENNFENSATFNQNIQLNNAQSGVYLLTVTDGEIKQTKKIVVE